MTTNPVSANANLDSFESVMAAMDAHLAASKKAKVSRAAPTTPASKPKQKQKQLNSLAALPSEADLDDMSDADLEAMDRELRAALHGADEDFDDMDEDDPAEVEELGEDGRREYRMMKDFLESYRAQAGQSGVVGNLFGRLGEANGQK